MTFVLHFFYKVETHLPIKSRTFDTEGSSTRCLMLNSQRGILASYRTFIVLWNNFVFSETKVAV